MGDWTGGRGAGRVGESEDMMKPSIHAMKLTLWVMAVAVGHLVSPSQAAAATETAVIAGGCFWCVEANFEAVPGVKSVVSGFTGGTLKDPTYDDVSHSETGHYEAVEIKFDPAKVSYATLIDLFLHSTDVVDAGGQFCDRGKSYRSAIFASAAQAPLAQAAIDQAAAKLGQRIVTPVLPLQKFYPADEYHQDYYKGSSIILTRRGPKTKASAYEFYRNACGRDARVQELWGASAQFLH